MSKRSRAKKSSVRFSNSTRRMDIGSWNFIIFLTLAFILLVVVLTQMNKTTFELRSKAGLTCPELKTPRAEDCPEGWTFKRDMNGCLAFFCDSKGTEETN